MPEKFLDTCIGIKRIENSSDGEIVRSYLSEHSLFTSTYVLMEFKRTVLKDAISLYYLLKEEPTMGDAYRRIKDMLDNPETEAEAQRWELLLGILVYPNPTESERDKAIMSLENLIRKGLILTFRNKITLQLSNTKCSFADKKPIKIEGRYVLNINSCNVDCAIRDTIIANRGVFEEILRKTKGTKESYFKELSDIIIEVLDDVDNMRGEYCKRLGDVVVSIDCHPEMELCTSDHHFDIICKAIGKSYYNPLKP